MLLRHIIPLLAALALGFGAATTAVLAPSDGLLVASAPPPTSTFTDAPFAALGVAEARGEEIAIGTAISGIIAQVFVEAGAAVTAGDPLFAIDARELLAEAKVRAAALAAAEARLQRVRAGTRPSELAPARARVATATARRDRAREAQARTAGLALPRALSEDERRARDFEVLEREAELAEAEAEVRRLEAEPYSLDLEVAERERDLARAELLAVESSIERLTVRAPVAGTVLRVRAECGAFAAAGAAPTLVELAPAGPMELRVQIAEELLDRWSDGQPAEAFARDATRTRHALQFVRSEPKIVTKRRLAGDSAERVDARVLEVIYRFAADRPKVWAGQHFDVWIAAAPE